MLATRPTSEIRTLGLQKINNLFDLTKHFRTTNFILKKLGGLSSVENVGLIHKLIRIWTLNWILLKMFRVCIEMRFTKPDNGVVWYRNAFLNLFLCWLFLHHLLMSWFVLTDQQTKMEIGVRMVGALELFISWLTSPIFYLMSLRGVKHFPRIRNPIVLQSATSLAKKIRDQEVS